jgi:hypothetical protein
MIPTLRNLKPLFVALADHPVDKPMFLVQTP